MPRFVKIVLYVFGVVLPGFLPVQQLRGQQLLSRVDPAISEQKVISYDTLIRNKLGSTDSIRNDVDYRLEKETARLNRQVDSLRSLHLPLVKYVQQLNDVYHNFREGAVYRLRQRNDSLHLPKNHRLEKIDSMLSEKTNTLDSLVKSGYLQNVSYDDLRKRIDPTIPDLAMPDLQIEGIDTSPVNIGNDLKAIQMPALQTPEVSTDLSIGNAPNVLDEVNALEDHTNGLNTIGDERKKLQDMDVARELEKQAENKMSDIGELKKVSEETRQAEELKKKAEILAQKRVSTDSIQTTLKEKIVDHFAGKEDVIKKDMEDMAKVQLKYRSFADSRFLPKRPPNEMKGKPFVERLIPGIGFQVFAQENVSVDVAPFIGYRFSGKINAGIGGYRRLTYLKDRDRLKAVNCFGIRSFGTYRIMQNFNAYAEAEYFKNDTRSNWLYDRDRSHHWKINLGVQKRYSIGKGFFGYLIVMYDLMKIKRFPNTEGGAVRFGFDYQIIRKKKDKEQNKN